MEEAEWLPPLFFFPDIRRAALSHAAHTFAAAHTAILLQMPFSSTDKMQQYRHSQHSQNSENDIINRMHNLHPDKNASDLIDR